MRLLGWLSGLFRWTAPDGRSKAFGGKATLAGALDIEYVDAIGRRSERYIEAKSLSERRGKLYLFGWCEQRQALRTFRVDRIAALSDGETGEIVNREDIRGWLIGRARG